MQVDAILGSSVILVVSQDRELEFGFDFGESCGEFPFSSEGIVLEIPAIQDQVWFFGFQDADGLVNDGGTQLWGEMEVGDECDLESVSGLGLFGFEFDIDLVDVKRPK